jgi:hypothetical protein
MQGFTKANVDINDLPKYVEKVLSEVAANLDLVKHVTSEEMITLYREFPPRANDARDGYIDVEDDDTADYQNNAVYNHGAATTGTKAKHKYYLTDLFLGSQLVLALKDTIYESYDDEPKDDGRFTAILYRLLTECKGDIEATTDPLIGYLIPQVDESTGKLNPNLIMLNEQLPMAQQMMDLRNRLVLARKELKKINEPEHNKITDEKLIHRVSGMIKTVHRYHTQDKLLNDFKESTDLKEAFKILTTFDSKLENQMKYAGPPQQVYTLQTQALPKQDLRSKITGDGRKKAHFQTPFERNRKEEEAGASLNQTPFNICLAVRDQYEVRNRELKLKPGATGNKDYKQTCLNCCGKKHRINECRSELGPHTKNANGSLKTQKICWDFKRHNCKRGDNCTFIHIDEPIESGGKSHKQSSMPNKHFRDGQYLKVREKAPGRYQFQKVNHIDQATSDNDSDTSDEDHDAPRKKKKKHKKKVNPWFNYNGSLGANIVMAVTLTMAVFGTNANEVTNLLHCDDCTMTIPTSNQSGKQSLCLIRTLKMHSTSPSKTKHFQDSFAVQTVLLP